MTRLIFGPFRRTDCRAEYSTAGWVTRHKDRRLHNSLGYVAPAEDETADYAAPNPEPQPI